MEKTIIDQYLEDFKELNNTINRMGSESDRIVYFLENIPKLLHPVWQAGFNYGIESGIKKEKERAKIIKSN